MAIATRIQRVFVFVCNAQPNGPLTFIEKKYCFLCVTDRMGAGFRDIIKSYKGLLLVSNLHFLISLSNCFMKTKMFCITSAITWSFLTSIQVTGGDLGDVEEIGRSERITVEKIDTMQSFFGQAIRKKKGNTDKLETQI